MLGIRRWTGCLLLALLLAGSAKATNGVRLAQGNGIWVNRSSTPQVTNNPAQVVNNLQAYSIKHIFLFTVGMSSASYAQYAPLLQTAHSSGMTVHAICASNSNVTTNYPTSGTLSPLLLSNAIQQVVMYNDSTNEPWRFDGVQMDVEGKDGAVLLALMQGVTVPSSLVFSAAVQPDEFAPTAPTAPYYIESYYSNMLATTSMDVLIPMIYIMDALGYKNGNLTYSFALTGSHSIAYKTTEIINRLPSYGQMMTGLSGYDYEAAVTKGGGPNWDPTGGWWGSQLAFSSGSYAVPYRSAHYPLVSVAYQPITGISSYRFDYSSTNWWDVNELTPIGLGLSIAAADTAGGSDPRYAGTASFVYHTIFDSTSERQAGLTMTTSNYPSPQVSLQVLSVTGSVARLRVTLTNANPSEQILGDSASTGVHLQLPPGASFVSADAGSFHAALGFDTAGNQRGSIEGSPVLELRRFFFENLSSQQAQSGEIVVTAPAPALLQYRAWMTAKDSVCNDGGTSVPYIARSPNDIHYSDPSRFMTYALFSNSLAFAWSAAYVGAVSADAPAWYLRFSESGVVTTPNPFVATNAGTVGAAGNGVPLVTNYGLSTSVLGSQPGALADTANKAFSFPSTGTNPVTVPYRSEWNLNGPFSVELWLKGGTNFTCPASSVQYDQAGWLLYQQDSTQTTGDGWCFRVYNNNSSSPRISAIVYMTVNPNAWYHIVGVYDGSSALLYTNGVLADSTAIGSGYVYVPNPSPTNLLTWGARSGLNARPYAGLMDEVVFYTNSLTPSQVAAHYAAATTNATGYASQILALHPAGYWRFNELLNPPVALNSGSAGEDGAYLHWSTSAAGLQPPAFPGLESTNRALQVFGTNGLVLLPPLNLNTNAVTIECWLKRSGDQSSYAGLVMHRNSNSTGACGLCFHAGSNHLGYWWNDAANTTNWDSGLLPPDGQWSYAAVSVGPSQAVISLFDGTTWSAATNPVSHAVQAFAGLTRVGSDGALSGRWFKGEMDEVAIYKGALTQSQLRCHALSAFANTNQPYFTRLPLSQTVTAGSAASLSAEVAGAGSISYQWKLNGTNLAATSLMLSFTSVDYTNAGQYTLAATNSYGGVLSPAATLTVLPPPAVTNLTYRLSTGAPDADPVLELVWPSGVLYSATNLAGPWVSNATPPWSPCYYLTPITTAPALFFKAR
jgi:hypothetical protein